MNTSKVTLFNPYFNYSFDKKRLKALISWIFKKSGEMEALRILDLLKETGFRHATKAGISIGLHDLKTPIQKSWLIAESQLAMNTTERDFIGAKITATERSQRIIDTWHRASESLSKQVVDYFGIYDRFNPVYIMALSGARGNFSQVRQLIGMRGLMADQQGKIVNFPIRSNLREGLTLTEYFISCSGARKGLVDTALRTADTGYLTRRLVDVSHHVVVKKIRCNTNRGIAFKSLQSYNKVLLPLKERLIGRVLAEDIEERTQYHSHTLHTQIQDTDRRDPRRDLHCTAKRYSTLTPLHSCAKRSAPRKSEALRSTQKRSAVSKIGVRYVKMDNLCPPKENVMHEQARNNVKPFVKITKDLDRQNEEKNNPSTKKIIAKKDTEISPKLALQIISVRDKVYIRSPLTCGFTYSVCQLCYGWSISQGTLVSLGDAVGVIAAQSIGEPGTQLTMRTFHTGGVFSGDLLQEIRAPHAGKIEFSKAFRGLLIRSAHGRIAFLSKSQGSLLLHKNNKDTKTKSKGSAFTEIPIQPFTMLFVRQGEAVENNRLLAEFSIQSKEGNQPIKTQQTIFAELSGKVIEDCSGKIFTKSINEDALTVSQGYLSSRIYKGSIRERDIFSLYTDPTLNRNFYTTQLLSSFSTLAGYFDGKKSTNLKLGIGTIPNLKVATVPKVRQKKQVFASQTHYLPISDDTFGEKNKKEQSQLFNKNKKDSVFKYGSISFKNDIKNNIQNKTRTHFFLKGKYLKRSHVRESTCKIFIALQSRTKPIWRPDIRTPSTKVKNVISTRSWLPTCHTQLREAQRSAQKQSEALRATHTHPCCLKGNDRKNGDDRNQVNLSVEEITKERKVENRKRPKKTTALTHIKGTLVCKTQILSSFSRKRIKSEDLENDVLKYIEPIKSGRLGFIKILSTRVGATLDYICPIKGLQDRFIKNMRLEKTRNKKVLLSNSFDLLPSKEQNLQYKSTNRYLHPEYLKKNRFFLQTIAEYGDVVYESYKNKSL